MTQNVVMYTVEVNTENPDKLLLPYLTANVRFVARQELHSLAADRNKDRITGAVMARFAEQVQR